MNPIEAKRRLKALRRELFDVQSAIKRLEARELGLKEAIRSGERVTKVIKGVALNHRVEKNVYGRSYSVETAGEGNYRRSQVYTNATNPKRFGVRCMEYRSNHKEMFAGAEWRSWALACKAADTWVVFGELPEYNGGAA